MDLSNVGRTGTETITNSGDLKNITDKKNPSPSKPLIEDSFSRQARQVVTFAYRNQTPLTSFSETNNGTRIQPPPLNQRELT